MARLARRHMLDSRAIWRGSDAPPVEFPDMKIATRLVLLLTFAIGTPAGAQTQKPAEPPRPPAAKPSPSPSPSPSPASPFAELKFRYIGPEGNRVSAVAGVPGDPQVYYAGAASGGIFKTT